MGRLALHRECRSRNATRCDALWFRYARDFSILHDPSRLPSTPSSIQEGVEVEITCYTLLSSSVDAALNFLPARGRGRGTDRFSQTYGKVSPSRGGAEAETASWRMAASVRPSITTWEAAIIIRHEQRLKVATSQLVVIEQGFQMAKFDPFLSLDCARVEGVGGVIQGKEGIKFCSVA